MGIGFDGFSLALFTGLTPSGTVAFAFMAVFLLVSRNLDDRTRTRIYRLTIVPLVVAWAGLIAAATHLGTPANALYAFSAVGSSPLSNEVASVVAFLFFSGMTWLYGFALKPKRGVSEALLAISVVLAANLLVHTAVAYAVPTVPSWNNTLAPISVVLGAGCSGLALSAAVLHMADWSFSLASLSDEGDTHEQGSWSAPRVQRLFVALLAGSLVMLAANVVVLGQYVDLLSTLGNNVMPAGEIAHAYDGTIVSYATLALVGLLFQASTTRFFQGSLMRLLVDVVGCLIVVAAAVFVRFPFYEAYLSVGF